jgi:hypothetical protein
MPKIGEEKRTMFDQRFLRRVASLKRSVWRRVHSVGTFSSKKELLREAIDEGFTQGPFMPAVFGSPLPWRLEAKRSICPS